MNSIYTAERADGKGIIKGILTFKGDTPYIKEDKKYSRSVKVMLQSLEPKKD